MQPAPRHRRRSSRDSREGLDAGLLPVLDDRDRHHRGRLRHAGNDQPPLRFRQHDHGRQRELHRLRFGGHVGHRDRRSAWPRTRPRIRSTLSSVTKRRAHVLYAHGRIRRVVQDDDVELLAGDRLRPQLDAVLARNAQRRGRPGQQRGSDADRDVGARQRGAENGRQRGQEEWKPGADSFNRNVSVEVSRTEKADIFGNGYRAQSIPIVRVAL